MSQAANPALQRTLMDVPVRVDVVLGEMRNPSLSRFSEMERSDSLCSLGVYDSQFWSSVLDNGPDVLGSDPAA